MSILSVLIAYFSAVIGIWLGKREQRKHWKELFQHLSITIGSDFELGDSQAEGKCEMTIFEREHSLEIRLGKILAQTERVGDAKITIYEDGRISIRREPEED